MNKFVLKKNVDIYAHARIHRYPKSFNFTPVFWGKVEHEISALFGGVPPGPQ